MKIDFLTTQPTAACSMFYSNALQTMPEVTLYDSQILNYDVILVMTYDHAHVKEIRKTHPNAKIGIIDPRNHTVADSVKHCDFLIVDSIEMEDYWAMAKKPIFRYVEYPNIPTVKKIHKDSNLIRIGYHGNQIHLDCMQETVTPALSNLAKNYKLELLVMHSGASHNGTEPWIPKDVNVKHVRWSMENYLNELSKCDIGLVPNNILHDVTEKSLNPLNRSYNYSIDDFSIRFKMPSNPGRFVIFGKLGIPVVADFYPSALQYLREDLKTGMVACNVGGWEKCLEKLILSTDLRQEMGDHLQDLVTKEFNFEFQNEKLVRFLKSL